jgi:PST family polysaccharide transporter
MRENKIFKNFIYSGFNQFLLMVFPIVTYPYLLKTLGLENMGQIFFIQSTLSYINIFLSYGFGTLGPRDIAKNVNNLEFISKYISSVYFIKFSIWVFISVFYFIFLIKFVNRGNINLYLNLYIANIAEVFAALWIFQGLEKFQLITIVNLIIKCVNIILIYIFIKNKLDILILTHIYIIVSIVYLLLTLYIIRRLNLKFIKIDLKYVLKLLKESSSVFTSTLFVQLYMNSGKVIIGNFLDMKSVAIFDIANKIVTILKIPINILSQIVIPKLSRILSIRLVNYYMFISFIISIILFTIFYLSSYRVVEFFSKDQIIEIAKIAELQSISIILISVSFYLGGNRLLLFGFNSQYTQAMLFNLLVYLLLFIYLYIYNLISVYSISLIYVLTEIFCLCFLFLIVKNKKLLV